MKLTAFQKVLNEEFIEVNCSVPKTIKCLQQQIGGTLITTPIEIRISFNCSETGKIRAEILPVGWRADYFPIYHVNGRVISKDNKTYVKITSVYRKTDILIRGLSSALIIPLFILKFFTNNIFLISALLLAFLFGVFAIIYLAKETFTYKKYGLEIVKSMENEIKKRVQNIEHWDD